MAQIYWNSSFNFTSLQLSGLLESVLDGDTENRLSTVRRAHELAIMWDAPGDLNSNQRRKLARILGESLHEAAEQLHYRSRGREEAGILWKQTLLIFEELHRSEYDSTPTDLVTSMLNYARYLYDVGRIPEMQVIATEARQICADNVSAFSSVATSLTENVYTTSLLCTTRLHTLNDPQGFEWRMIHYTSSIHIVQRDNNSYLSLAEDVADKRQLFAEDPDRHRSTLGDALYIYGLSLHKAKLADTACVAQKECVTHRRELARRDSEMYSTELAISLQSYSTALRSAGRYDEACEVAKEAVGRFRSQVHQRPNQQCKRRLAGSLHAFALCLHGAQKSEDAYMVEEEAIDIIRSICSTESDLSKRFLPHLASALYNYSIIRHTASTQASDTEEADRHCCSASMSISEAVTLRRQLFKDEAESQRAPLASSLVHQCACLLRFGRLDEACGAGLEAVDLQRQVYETDRDHYREIYISSLAFYADALLAARRLRDACICHKKIVDLHRVLYQQDRDMHRLDLANWLRRYGRTLREAVRDTDATSVEEEAEALMA